MTDIFTFPASSGQERLWLFEQLERGGSVYNQPVAYRLSGPLDVVALEASFNEVLCRHEALRTTLARESGVVVQRVAAEMRLPLPVTDLSGRAVSQEDLCYRVNEEVAAPFDFETGPLIRARLFRLSQHEHVLVLVCHHAVFDGWSVGLLLRELSEIYAAYLAGRPSALTEIAIQYPDYSAWERECLSDERVAQQLAYWTQRLDGVATLEIPFSHSRPKVQTYRGTQLPLHIPPELVSALKAVAVQEKVTLFMVVVAAFKALLHRYSGQADIAVGIVSANRPLAELQDLIGYFANTLVLRTDLSGNPGFVEYLAQVREAVCGALAHQELPFQRIVESLQGPRDRSRSPLFQVLFNQLPPMEQPTLGEVLLSSFPADTGVAKFDLSVYLGESEGALVGFLEFNTDLFAVDSMQRLIGHYQRLLLGVAANPRTRLSELPLLGREERGQMLTAWNSTTMAFPHEQTVPELFEAQAKRRPHAVAVRFGEEQLTYGQLDERSSALAAHLQDKGLLRGMPVGLCVERSPAMLVALLAVLKAGGAYVPLDPAFPRDRLQYMLEDSGADFLLTAGKLADLFAPSQRTLIDIGAWAGKTVTYRPYRAGGPAPESLAYVLYTSGSTGRPKGVEISHRALTNFLCSMAERPGFGEDDSLLAITTISFDIAALELYLPLVTGGCIELASRETAADGTRLREHLERTQPTHLQATPTTWRMLLSAGWVGDRTVVGLIGGEALPQDLLAPLVGGLRSLWNMYGPTETTVWSSLEEMRGAADPITIGRPIGNTSMYILDAARQPVPVGVPGELHIGGASVAQGYRNLPELTAEKFVSNPFDGIAGSRLFRTGDLARYLPDGRIVHLGRIDNQVKIRGFRIELGEIEAVLSAHPSLSEVCVVPRTDAAGIAILVAYVVRAAGAELSATALRQHLLEVLPDYMVPGVYVEVDAFPLTPNGKIDRKRLPAPGQDTLASQQPHLAPRTPTEVDVSRIIADLLQIQNVGASSDFFELGGHSIAAISLVARLNAHFNVELPLQILFEASTVEQLAVHIDSASGGDVAPASEIEEKIRAVLQRVLERGATGYEERLSYLKHRPQLLERLLAELRREFGNIATGFGAIEFLAAPTIAGLVKRMDPHHSRTSEQIILLRKGGSKSPLFLVHSGEGHVFRFRALAGYLQIDRPIYGIRALSIWENRSLAYDRGRSIEKIAARYIQAMKSIQAQGPYALGGACSGGILAFEMARQLRAAGEQLSAPVLLMDSYLWEDVVRPVARQSHSPASVSIAVHQAKKALRRCLNVNVELWSELRLRARRLVATRLGKPEIISEDERSMARHFYATTLDYIKEYQPGEFDGSVVVVRTTINALPEQDWSQFVIGNVTTFGVDGEHLSMLEEPKVNDTAAFLSAHYN